MMTKIWSYVLCAVIMSGMAGIAVGTPITFDLTGDAGRVPSIVFTVDGVTMTATAQSSVGSPQVSQSVDGLGVRTGGSISGDSNQIDQVDAFETLVLTFDPSSKPVELLSVTFGRVGLDDDFNMSIDGNVLVSSAFIPGGSSNDAASSSFDFTIFPAGLRTGTVFTFTGPGEDDDYRVQSLTISTTPEPSSLLLLGSDVIALGGVGFFRKRKEYTQIES